jgi:hypothetical protein
MDSSIRVVQKALAGTLFDGDVHFREYWGRKFTEEDIFHGERNFLDAAIDNRFEPTGKVKEWMRSVTLNDFFLNEHNNNSKGNRSLFLKYLLNPPKILSTQKERNEDLVNADAKDAMEALKSWYVEQYTDGLNRLTEQDMNTFRVIANRIEKEWRDRRGGLGYSAETIFGFMKLVTDAMDKEVEHSRGKAFTLGWFHPKWFDTWFFQYVKGQGVWESQDQMA